MKHWYTIFQETCGCGGRPKEKIRMFAVEAVDLEDARAQALLRVAPGTVLIIEPIV